MTHNRPWQTATLQDVQVAICPQSLAPSVEELAIALPETELALVKEWHAQVRRQEFLVGRWLFHQISGMATPLLRTGTGAPAWPSPWAGSISHKNGHVAIALKRAQGVFSLGLDLESAVRVGIHLEPKICGPRESQLLTEFQEAYPKCERKQVLALAFSFKESLYKAHYPLGQVFFSFHDAEITALHPGSQTITAVVNQKTLPWSRSGYRVEGSYQWLDLDGAPHVVTLVKEQQRS